MRARPKQGPGVGSPTRDTVQESDSLVMPRRKSHRSLQRLCLENIAENMQPVWTKDYTDNYLDKYQFRYVQGPFSELAGSLVQELLQLMGKRLTRAMLHLLLVPHLKELSLRACPKLVSNAITQMVTMRCKNLTSLDLKGCSRVPADALVDVIEGLPGLTKLDLEDTQSNTQVLSAVGSTCQRLRQLNVSNCSRLSPASLLHLAYDPTAGTFCCPALQILEADGMGSDWMKQHQDLPWALAYLLLALPSLIFLENECVTDAVQLIHGRQFDGGAHVVPAGFPPLKELAQCRVSAHSAEASSHLTLPLKELLEVDESSLPAACAVCPHLAKVKVVVEESLGPVLHFLPQWPLTSLGLYSVELQQLRKLLPVTAHLGPRLESLKLHSFSSEDEASFHTILGHCPNLREFGASLYSEGRPGGGEEALGQEVSLPPQHFRQLHDFSLMCSTLEDDQPAPPLWVLRASLVSLLKHSPHLRTLRLHRMPFPLDEVFEEVLAALGPNALPHLTDLSLLGCSISIGTIHQILSLQNPLSHLDLRGCPDIHQKDYKALLRRISREGLEVHVTWK